MPIPSEPTTELKHSAILAELNEVRLSGICDCGDLEISALRSLRCVKSVSAGANKADIDSAVRSTIFDCIVNRIGLGSRGRSLLAHLGWDPADPSSEPIPARHAARQARAAAEAGYSEYHYRTQISPNNFAFLAIAVQAMEDDALDGTTTTSVTFRSVRDIHILTQSGQESRPRAALSGLIAGRRVARGVVYLDLYDASGWPIQLVADPQRCGTATAEAAAHATSRSRAVVTGTIGRAAGKHETLSVFLDTFDLHDPFEFSEIDSVSNVAARVLLGRLIVRATEFFSEPGRDFEPFEPQLITTSTGATDLGLLEVVYPGYGANVYLSPSPTPQLLSAILSTGSRRFYAISRCFSRAFRDGYTSSQSTICCARMLDTDMAEVCRVASDAIRHIFTDIGTQPEYLEQGWLESDWQVLKVKTDGEIRKLHSPEIQVLDEPDGPVFRICWPPNIIVAEGDVTYFGDLAVGSLTIHLERMLTRLVEANLWRMQNVSTPSQPGVEA